MISKFRLMSLGGVLVVLGFVLLWSRQTSSAVLYTGYSLIDSGPLTLEVNVQPPVASPGATLQLSARVMNRGAATLTPSVVLRLPRGLSADVYALPPGATLDLQDNRIDWLPTVPAGATSELALELIVQTTDILAPEQSVESVLRHQGAEQATEAGLWIGIPPLIGGMLPQKQVAVGQPIRLQAEIAGPGPLKTVWDLGDGRRLELNDPLVVFPTAGQHGITLEVSNPGGTVIRRELLTVLPNPVASFRPDDDTPAVGQAVTFVNESGGQSPLSVFWDFGDGATLMGEQQPTHVYRQGGIHRVRLAIENAHGRSEAVWDVAVGQAPTADMAISDRTTVGEPLIGQAFTDQTETRFTWDMGDGRRHEGITVSHLYRRPGDYYVTLIADNGFGQTAVGRWVRVEDGVSTLYLPLAANEAGGSLSALSTDAPAPTDLDPVVTTLAERFALDPVSFPAGTSAAEQLFAYLNAARARFDLPPLAYNQQLSGAAQTHTIDKAAFPDNPHIGSDGATPAERLLRGGYRGGYAGEATAWGFTDPRLAVEFWMNSDGHRPLLLNRLATDVGIGYIEDFATANVWHWTAEFGVSYGAPARAVLRAQMPSPGQTALDSEMVNYSWLWPLPLAAGQRFTVYLVTDGQPIVLGSVDAPVYGSRYVLSADARTVMGTALTLPKAAEWFVRLEDGLGQTMAESERRALALAVDPVVSAQPPLALTPTSTPTPTATPTATPWPTSEAPTPEPPPVVVTATPLPEATAEPPPVIVTPTPDASPTP